MQGLIRQKKEEPKDKSYILKNSKENISRAVSR
jgi:hypothetical protein